jgi:hypothetical protein
MRFVNEPDTELWNESGINLLFAASTDRAAIDTWSEVKQAELLPT